MFYVASKTLLTSKAPEDDDVSYWQAGILSHIRQPSAQDCKAEASQTPDGPSRPSLRKTSHFSNILRAIVFPNTPLMSGVLSDQSGYLTQSLPALQMFLETYVSLVFVKVSKLCADKEQPNEYI